MRTRKITALAVALMAVAIFGNEAHCLPGRSMPWRHIVNPIGATSLKANNLTQLTADKDFTGTVYLSAPVTLQGNLVLTCDLRPLQGAIITRNGYTLTLNTLEAGNYQIFNPTDTGTIQFTQSVEIPPQWFGATNNSTYTATNDTAFAAWGKAIQTPLSTSGIDYPIGIIPGGNYALVSMPTITTPVKIESGGTVTLYAENSSGVFWTVNNATLANVGPVISGPIFIHTHETPSIVFDWVGTSGGSVSDLWVSDTSNDITGCGIELREGFGGSPGCYGNIFENVEVDGFGTNWRLETYNVLGPSGANVTANTFVNCKSYVAVMAGVSTWAADTGYFVGQLVVPDADMDGVIFKCTTAGMSGGTEPNWTTAATIGSTITDGGAAWTRVSWADTTSVPSPGICWLIVNSPGGNMWYGGDTEGGLSSGYEMAWVYQSLDIAGYGAASFSQVQGMHLEDEQTAPWHHHVILVDSATASQTDSSPAAVNSAFIFEPSDFGGWVDYCLPLDYAPPFAPNCIVANGYNDTLMDTSIPMQITFSSSITPDENLTRWFVIPATGSFTVCNPVTQKSLQPWVGMDLTFTIQNQTASSLTVSWGSQYKCSYTPPAAGQENTIHFVWNGSYWVQDSPQGPDITCTDTSQ